MGSELIYRGHDPQPQEGAGGYSPKPLKRWWWISRPLRYLLREQRLLFVLVGMALATLVVALLPRAPPAAGSAVGAHLMVDLARRSTAAVSGGGHYSHRTVLPARGFVGGKVPLGLKRKGLRIVVTGGAGFVGSHLVDRLIARGDSVIVVDNFFTGRKENVMHHFGNPNFELIRHDVVEPLLLETNVVGTLNMLGLAKRVGARFLLTSTSEVYGDPLQHPQVETYWGNVNPIGVRSCYDEGKRTAETLTMDYHRGAQVEALRKEPMTVYGDGKQTRSFQYVSDLVEGLMRLMEGEHVGPFNLGNPGEFTMLELAKVVQETIDPNARIEFRPNTEDDPHKRKPDINRAKELLGWEPKVALRQGLPLMVSDFRKRIFGDHSGSDATTTTGTGTA
ncbi:UDP-glucuronic acid decarboxylase 2 [Cocos nucifera]|uniref:UDP-glucuronate decarboxylase n=1 Tax=Cocos nucifera TaxID=13894 RepID=A0A8K0I6F4_COCNU|nr:UDP-glucuronic acid decarboxylase 2 [Cocos nucifera]